MSAVPQNSCMFVSLQLCDIPHYQLCTFTYNSCALIITSSISQTKPCVFMKIIFSDKLDLFRGRCYKTFFVHDLRIFVLSQSVCPWQTFPAQSNKHSSSVRKSVNHGHKSFITLTQGWSQSYKIFYSQNLQIFEISVCPWQAFTAQSNICGLGQEPTLEWST